MKARRAASTDCDTIRPSKPVFLATFKKLVRRGQWVTCASMARLMGHEGDVAVTKDVSRKLSNLSRFGHLERRKVGEQFEYRLPKRSTTFMLQLWLQPTTRRVP